MMASVSSMAYGGEITNIQLGARPYFLVEDISPKYQDLKDKLKSCTENTPQKSDFSIGHRGAPLQFPEHTEESYMAAMRMGAGILECDVAFTKDKELVCRHSHGDLHTTTDILLRPDLAPKCSQPFVPASEDNEAMAECRTSDITLAEYKSLNGKMDGANKKATNVEDYVNGTASWRTDLYASRGTVMTHKESIALFQKYNVKMTPELKTPADDMPFDGFSYDDFRQKLIDEYREAGINPQDVYMQSFNKDDILYIIKNAPEFGEQAVYLVEEMVEDISSPESLKNLKAQGVNILAPALPMLVENIGGEIKPSQLAKDVKEAGFEIITWSLERSGPLASGGGWYYSSIEDIPKTDGDMMKYLDVLAKDVGVIGVFSDWPATTTYYANCFGL